MPTVWTTPIFKLRHYIHSLKQKNGNGKSKTNLTLWALYLSGDRPYNLEGTHTHKTDARRVHCLLILTTFQLSLELFEQRHHLFTTHVQNELELVNIEPVTHPGVSAIYYSIQHLFFTISLQCDIHLYIIYICTYI